MIFVPFTGIDNHKKCVTFAGALLGGETIECYTWLLKVFMETFKKEPNVVITDQDPAMIKAIPETFKYARHRLCIWHIMRNFPKHVCYLSIFYRMY